MPEQDRLQLIGRTFASVADGESATFARELGRVLLALERDLLGLVSGVREGKRGILSKVGRLLTLRKEIRQALEASGYTRLVTRASLDAVERMAAVAQRSRLANAGAALGGVMPKRLEVLAGLMRADLLGLGDTLAHQVWRSAVMATYTDQPAQKIVATLAKTIEKSRAQAQTLFDTQVSIIGRQIVATAPTGRSADKQAYMYVGPVDGVVRDFCLDLVGKVFTMDRIEQMDNGQLPNVFITSGGYSCRHSFLAVSDPALEAIANTGQRAEGFDTLVSSAKANQRRSSRRAA